MSNPFELSPSARKVLQERREAGQQKPKAWMSPEQAVEARNIALPPSQAAKFWDEDSYGLGEMEVEPEQVLRSLRENPSSSIQKPPPSSAEEDILIDDEAFYADGDDWKEDLLGPPTDKMPEEDREPPTWRSGEYEPIQTRVSPTVAISTGSRRELSRSPRDLPEQLLHPPHPKYFIAPFRTEEGDILKFREDELAGEDVFGRGFDAIEPPTLEEQAAMDELTTSHREWRRDVEDRRRKILQDIWGEEELPETKRNPGIGTRTQVNPGRRVA